MGTRTWFHERERERERNVALGFRNCQNVQLHELGGGGATLPFPKLRGGGLEPPPLSKPLYQVFRKLISGFGFMNSVIMTAMLRNFA